MSEDRQNAAPGAANLESISFRLKVAIGAAAAFCVASPAQAGVEAGREGSAALFEPVSAATVIAPAPQQDVLSEDAIAKEFKPQVLRAKARLQCVPFARDASGIEIRGDAKSWWAQAAGKYAREKLPIEGAVIVMRGYAGAARGHVGVVRRVISERKILIDHANWLNSGEVTVRVPVIDVSPKGDWSEVRVWHVPGAHWGKRIYGAEGFILPKPMETASPGGAAPSPTQIAAAF